MNPQPSTAPGSGPRASDSRDARPAKVLSDGERYASLLEEHRLSASQRRALRKLGDIYCPGDGDLPSFSASGCDQHAGVLLSNMNRSDLGQLKMLLSFLALLPRRLIAFLVARWESVDPNGKPGLVASNLRFLRLGVRGLVFSLYYSGRVGHRYDGPTPLDTLGYHVAVYTGDLGPPAQGADDVLPSR